MEILQVAGAPLWMTYRDSRSMSMTSSQFKRGANCAPRRLAGGQLIIACRDVRGDRVESLSVDRHVYEVAPGKRGSPGSVLQREGYASQSFKGAVNDFGTHQPI